MRAPLAFLALVLSAAQTGATCNVIPSTDRVFPSTLGTVSRPFARPGDTVIVRRDEPVFARDAAGNSIALAFMPVGVDNEIPVGSIAALSREAGSGCSDDDCTPSGCRCVRFAFPNTDDSVALPGDGLTLAGPVEIRIRTGGEETARIGELFIGDSKFHDDLFPHFVALPPANSFLGLIASPRSVLAADDTAGNLYIPLDFTGIVPDDERRTRFLKAMVPDLGEGGSVDIDVFTVAGQRLPPLVRQVQERGDELLGTADSRESVFRIRKGALRPKLQPVDNGGPIRIPMVSGSADAREQADPGNMVVGSRFAVYEARECDPGDVRGCGPGESSGGNCIDLNGDGDGTDYFLYALDLQAPDQQPIVVDEIDACKARTPLGERLLAGYPATFPPFNLYSFSASDALVAFRIVEAGVDMNANGHADDLLRAGAYDLAQQLPVPLAEGSTRQEVDGNLLAFSLPSGGADDGDALYWYEAGTPGAAPRLVSDAGHPRYLVTRHPVGGVDRGRRVHPFDFAVAGTRIVFVAREALQQEDLTMDGDTNDDALLLFDAASGAVTNLRQAMTSRFDDARLAATPHRVAFQTDLDRTTLAVGVRDLDDLATLPRFICRSLGVDAVLAPSISDAIVPCLWGGHVGEIRVLLRDGIEQPLGLQIGHAEDVQVSGNVLVVGVDEGLQNEDLDDNGAVGPGVLVLHSFQAMRRGTPTNFRRRLIRSTPPYLQFISRGLVVLSGSETKPVRTIFRDVDGDGIFEEPIPLPGSDTGPIADNCPTIPNPDQAFAPAFGVGVACECPVLQVETVRAFPGSRVHLPVDFDPGLWPVSAGNFSLDAQAGLGVVGFESCQAGPIVHTARAQFSCLQSPPGVLVSVLVDHGTLPIPNSAPARSPGTSSAWGRARTATPSTSASTPAP